MCESFLAALLWPAAAQAGADHQQLSARARDALTRAAAFFRNEVAVEGSYGWRYSADLTYRRGEDRMTPSQGWVQPPGTHAVGLAMLQAFAATDDRRFLEGAVETAHALAATQLDSGGWYPLIEFDPEQRKAWSYRRLPAAQRDRAAQAENKYCNASSIDDNISQSALELLMRVDVALRGDDTLIHEAVFYGLGKLIEAQYPNGAWPVRFDWRVRSDADARAPRRARNPESWSRTWVEIEDRLFYTTNDNLMGDTIRVLLVAHQLYGREEYRAAAIRAGEFLLAAQMPEPQPGWAQQYNRHMEPMWGRKFEPPAIASWETRRLIDTLLDLCLYTGDQRYREAAGRAAAWLEASPLPDGCWARFYELRTNPLYMTSDDALTYDDADTPRHYSFKGVFDVPRTLERYRSLPNGEDVMVPAPLVTAEVARALAGSARAGGGAGRGGTRRARSLAGRRHDQLGDFHRQQGSARPLCRGDQRRGAAAPCPARSLSSGSPPRPSGATLDDQRRTAVESRHALELST